MHRGETANPAAYQLYLKGRYYAGKFDVGNVQKGFDYFQQAIALDPNYALAYDGLSYYYQLVEDLYFPPAEVMPKAEQAARKALTIDESIPDSHVALGSVLTFYDFDWAGAEREFKRAIELDPNYAPAHAYYSWYLISVGRPDEAVAEARRASALDPTSAEMASFPGWWLYLAHRYDESIAEFGKCLELDPEYLVCMSVLAEPLERRNRLADAIATATKTLKIEPRWSWSTADLARAYALSGRRIDAQKLLDQMLTPAKDVYVSDYLLATAFTAMGDKQRALDELEKAWSSRSFFLDFIQSDPKVDLLRSEPRFQELVRKMNFPR